MSAAPTFLQVNVSKLSRSVFISFLEPYISSCDVAPSMFNSVFIGYNGSIRRFLYRVWHLVTLTKSKADLVYSTASYTNNTSPTIASITSPLLPLISPSATSCTRACYITVNPAPAQCWYWERRDAQHVMTTNLLEAMNNIIHNTSTIVKTTILSDRTSLSHPHQTNAAGTITQEITGYYNLTTVM